MRYSGDDDPFGVNLRSFGDKDSKRFTGQILDEEQGLYYYGARYYLPEIGRFLSGDPLRQHPSLYAYCANNPISLVDPTGMADTWNPFSADFWTAENWVSPSAPSPVDSGAKTATATNNLPAASPRVTAPQTNQSGQNSYVDPTINLGLNVAGAGFKNLLGPASITSLVRDHGLGNTLMTAGSFVPVIGEAVTAVNILSAASEIAGVWITNNILAPMLNAAPPQMISTGNGHMIPNPALMDDQTLCNGN